MKNKLFAILFAMLVTAISLPLTALEDRLDQMDKPWNQPPNRMDIREYVGTVYAFQEMHPELVNVQIRARSPKGLPIFLLKITDPATPDADKNVILLTTFHSGAERTGTCGLLGFVEWLLGNSKQAARALRQNIILVMPNCNPEATFLVEDMKNSQGTDIYTQRHGNDVDLETLEPKNPDAAPEIVAFNRVIDEFAPEIHVDIHGTGLHFNGWIQVPTIGRAGSNAMLRAWDRHLINAMIEAANRKGFGMCQIDSEWERIVWGGSMVPWQKNYCEMGTQYYSTALYAYFKTHTMTFIIESTWRSTVVEPLKGMLEYLSNHRPAVDIIKRHCGPVYLESAGKTAQERRAARVSLWQKQNGFLVGSSYPETSGYAVNVVAYGAAGLLALTGSMGDNGRWGQITLEELRKNIACLAYMNLPELRRFLEVSPPSTSRILFEKGVFSPTQEIAPPLDCPYTIVTTIATSNADILYVSRNGDILVPGRDYTVKSSGGFTDVRVTIPSEAAAKEPVQLICCAWNPPVDRSLDHGYLPKNKAKKWIEKKLDDDPLGGPEVKKAEEILKYHQEHPDEYNTPAAQ